MYQLKIWHIIYYIIKFPGVSAAEVASLFGLSKRNVYEYIQKFNKNGVKGVILKKRGGRNHSYLSIKMEENLMKEITEYSKSNPIYKVNDIKKIIENVLDRNVTKYYILQLLKRNNWKKDYPDSYNHEQDTESKPPQKIWKPRPKTQDPN